jgi:hypothetical protein
LADGLLFEIVSSLGYFCLNRRLHRYIPVDGGAQGTITSANGPAPHNCLTAAAATSGTR